MEHVLYFDGDTERIAWQLEGDPGSMQIRRHADIYRGKVTNEQSRYIALHVGIFWCIGTFRIKDADTVHAMITSESMLEHMERRGQPDDAFIVSRAGFIDRLIQHRGLKVVPHRAEYNPASELLRSSGMPSREK